LCCTSCICPAKQMYCENRLSFSTIIFRKCYLPRQQEDNLAFFSFFFLVFGNLPFLWKRSYCSILQTDCSIGCWCGVLHVFALQCKCMLEPSPFSKIIFRKRNLP
jgi:hypothetical protein